MNIKTAFANAVAKHPERERRVALASFVERYSQPWPISDYRCVGLDADIIKSFIGECEFRLGANYEDVVSALEKKISGIRSMTAMLDDGMTPEDVLREVLSGFKPVFLGRQELSFRCDCSKARVRKALYSIGAKDLNEMIGEGQPAELVCHFCNTKYRFSIEELKEIAEQQKNGKEKSL